MQDIIIYLFAVIVGRLHVEERPLSAGGQSGPSLPGSGWCGTGQRGPRWRARWAGMARSHCLWDPHVYVHVYVCNVRG